MQRISLVARDNARTPMQWNKSEHAGFTTGFPWLDVNRRYEEINVEQDLSSEQSVYKFYQCLIKYKKDNYHIINDKIINITYHNDLIVYDKPGYKFIGNMSSNVREYDFNNYDLSNYNIVEEGLLKSYQFILIRKDSN